MEISDIKHRLSILKVLSHYHLKPDKNHRLCCPFHNDNTPSLQVYPETGTWTCFSSNCSAGSGDQVDFIMRKEGITKHLAILKAQEATMIEIARVRCPEMLGRIPPSGSSIRIFSNRYSLSKL